MSQIDDVLRGGLCAEPVVDVDARDARCRCLIYEYERESAPKQPSDRGGFRIAGVDQGTVNGDISRGHDAFMTRSRQQGAGQTARLELVGDGGEEVYSDLIGE